MNKLNHLLGHPLAEIPVVHVTGTNGKGSVCFKIASALSASGIKTGLFLSPHISSFKERIQVDHKLLSDEDVEVNIQPVSHFLILNIDSCVVCRLFSQKFSNCVKKTKSPQLFLRLQQL